jgi:hypothetical protein
MHRAPVSKPEQATPSVGERHRCCREHRRATQRPEFLRLASSARPLPAVVLRPSASQWSLSLADALHLSTTLPRPHHPSRRLHSHTRRQSPTECAFAPSLVRNTRPWQPRGPSHLCLRSHRLWPTLPTTIRRITTAPSTPPILHQCAVIQPSPFAIAIASYSRACLI